MIDVPAVTGGTAAQTTQSVACADPPPGSFAAHLEAALLYRHHVTLDEGQVVITTTGRSHLIYTVLVHDIPGGVVVSRSGKNVLAITMPTAPTELLAQLVGAALQAQIDTDMHLSDVG